MNNLEELWHGVLAELERIYDVNVFNELFAPITHISRFHKGTATIVIDNVYDRKKLSTLYINKINEIASNVANTPIRVKFVSADELANEEMEVKKSVRSNIDFHTDLDPSRTFGNFIVGESNRFAFRSAQMVAAQPGEIYNPLYIFGGVGLGKTHLMNAIGNSILDDDIEKKVLYISASKFVEEFVSMLNKKTSDALQEKYNSIDVLLIDDIQFLKGTETQHQFFKIFNYLHACKKQIVITSDRPASELKDIMERLTSRFAWGLAVDINLPDLPLIKRILVNKLDSQRTKVDIDDAVLDFLGTNFHSNIRDLEGALTRLLAYSLINDVDTITVDFAKEALDALLKTKTISNRLNENNYDRIISVVADFYNILVDDLIGKNRSAKFTMPRHIAMYLIRSLYDVPYKSIGLMFGGRDHSSVLSAYEKIENDLQYNDTLKSAIDTIKRKLSTK